MSIRLIMNQNCFLYFLMAIPTNESDLTYIHLMKPVFL